MITPSFCSTNTPDFKMDIAKVYKTVYSCSNHFMSFERMGNVSFCYHQCVLKTTNISNQIIHPCQGHSCNRVHRPDIFLPSNCIFLHLQTLVSAISFIQSLPKSHEHYRRMEPLLTGKLKGLELFFTTLGK